MLENWIRKLLGPAALLAVVSTVWVAAWCKSVQAQAERHYWPAAPIVHTYHFAPDDSDNNTCTADAPASGDARAASSRDPADH